MANSKKGEKKGGGVASVSTVSKDDGKKKIPPMPKVGESKYEPKYCRKLWEYFMTYEGPGIPQMSEFARSIPVALKTVRNWRNAHEDFGVVYQACMDYQQELLNNGGLTGTLNPRMVQFVLSANHKVREYTRINAEDKGSDMEMSSAGKELLPVFERIEQRLTSGFSEIPMPEEDMLNEGAVPAQEREEDDE